MRKIFKIILLLSIVFAMSSCSSVTEKISKVILFDGDFVMGNLDGTVKYKGVLYSDRDRWDTYYRYYDSDYNNHQGEVIGTVIDMYGAFGDVSKTCERDFGDNVIKVSAGYVTDLLFKEGFAFPDYKTVKIDKVYVDSVGNEFYLQSEKDIENQCVEIFVADETNNLYITDIVDLDNPTVHENLYDLGDVYVSKGYMLCTLKDYKTIYLGFYEIYEYKEGLYLKIDNRFTLYKVKSEHQQNLKDKIVELQLKD